MTHADLTAFLDRAICDYLLADIRSMKRIEVPEGQTGAASYSIVIAVLVGCELLGRLAGAPQCQAVEHFWRKFMPEPYRPLGDLARALVRNGVAHLYSTVHDVVIVRNDPGCHLHRDKAGVLYLDCFRLAEDFERAYAGAKQEILGDIGALATLADIVQRAQDDRSSYATVISSLPLMESSGAQGIGLGSHLAVGASAPPLHVIQPGTISALGRPDDQAVGSAD
jgi:hypothetical protein